MPMPRQRLPQMLAAQKESESPCEVDAAVLSEHLKDEALSGRYCSEVDMDSAVSNWPVELVLPDATAIESSKNRHMTAEAETRRCAGIVRVGENGDSSWPFVLSVIGESVALLGRHCDDQMLRMLGKLAAR